MDFEQGNSKHQNKFNSRQAITTNKHYQTLQAYQLMQQQQTQRNPDSTLRDHTREQKAVRYQQQIREKTLAHTYTSIQNSYQKQEALNQIIRETTHEIFEPKVKPIKEEWITQTTHDIIQTQHMQWHEARIAGNNAGVPRWEQAFK